MSKSTTSWVGCDVSIDCGDELGSYQGTIAEIDDLTITLNKAFKDGLPHADTTVTVKAVDIRNIEIIDDNVEPTSEKQHSTVEIVKSAKKMQKFAMTDSLNSVDSKNNGCIASPSVSAVNNYNLHLGKFQNHNGQFNQKHNSTHGNSFFTVIQGSNNIKSKPIDIQGKPGKSNGGSYLAGSTPNKKEKDRERRRNEICFGTPSDDPILNEEFDFEKNLALFDKQALWEELNQAQKPDIVRQTDNIRRNQSQLKYRHDENILESNPITQRVIIIPKEGRGHDEYVTDDGLIIPTLTNEFRMKLLTACGLAGLGGGQLFARAATDVALQLLGGTRRLHPHNTHQMPTVAFLIGPHRQGAVGLMCARHLASHGVSTIVFVATHDLQEALKSHITIYKMTGNKLTSNIQELPTVDLIIMALCEDKNDSSHYIQLIEWINQSRAPVLALDPPSTGIPNVIARYSLLPILPLSHSSNNGKLYLCNLAIPHKIFNDLGIQYASPFGAKSVIALHPKH